MFGNIGERAVAIVAIEDVRRPLKIRWRAVGRKALLNAEGCRFDAVIEVVHHKKVEPPVVVVIEPSCSYRPCLAELWDKAADSSLLGHIREGTVAVVVEKLVPVDSGQ